MQNSLLDIARSAAAAVLNMGLRDFCRQEPSQISLMGLQIIWTIKVQEGLERLSKTKKTPWNPKEKKSPK